MYYAANRKPKDSETLALVEIAIYCATVNQENDVLKVSNINLKLLISWFVILKVLCYFSHFANWCHKPIQGYLLTRLGTK